MVNSLLSLIKQEGSLNFGEACIYALIGFALVFAGIVLIIFIIWLIGLIMRKTNNLEFLSKIKIRKKKNQDVTESVQVADDGEISDEVKAAIVAAIMAYYYEEKPECEFKVRRIKRI
ncbi:MAG: OadG family protein [Clostridia bacterium]|nr:OadG family protein [Clostridia bacterium]MDE7306519.1 OadG family protein [Clostridia bacterium]